jgi:hypothetical protein
MDFNFKQRMKTKRNMMLQHHLEIMTKSERCRQVLRNVEI